MTVSLRVTEGPGLRLDRQLTELSMVGEGAGQRPLPSAFCLPCTNAPLPSPESLTLHPLTDTVLWVPHVSQSHPLPALQPPRKISASGECFLTLPVPFCKVQHFVCRAQVCPPLKGERSWKLQPVFHFKQKVGTHTSVTTHSQTAGLPTWLGIRPERGVGPA